MNSAITSCCSAAPAHEVWNFSDCTAVKCRPGAIQPLHGARSKTASYRLFYTLAAPLMPLLRRLWPRAILSTESMGDAMLNAARHGGPGGVLESADIYTLARGR